MQSSLISLLSPFITFNAYSCVHVCTCTCFYVCCVCVPVCACVRKPEVNHGCCTSGMTYFILRQGFSLGHKLLDLAKVCGHESSKSMSTYPCLLHGAGTISLQYHTHFLLWMLRLKLGKPGGGTQVLLLGGKHCSDCAIYLFVTVCLCHLRVRVVTRAHVY